MQPGIYRYGFSILVAGLWLMMLPLVSAQTAQEPTTDKVNAEVRDSADVDNSVKVGGGAEVDDSAKVSGGVEVDASAKVGGSAEVEHNEENYRRFMELRDRGRRTSDLPTNAYQPGSQKLDKLPESSQKHLRNELRGVILKEGEWQEGDENKRYAYVPSEAAKGDRELQLQEAEAWDELVEKYQEREAQIHGNSAQSQAARKAANAASAPGNPESSQSDSQSGGQQGSEAQGTGTEGQDGQSGQSAQAGETGQSGQASQQSSSDSSKDRAQDSYSPASEEAQQAEARNTGVSENALQFLTQSQSAGQPGSQQSSQQSAQQNSQSGSPQSIQQDSQQGAQQPAPQVSQQESQQSVQQDSQQTPDSEQSSASDTEKEDAEKEGTEKEGAENKVADTFTQQSSEKPTEPPPTVTPLATEADEVSKAGATQNAFEALSRGTQAAPPADTLSIEELSNAQGVMEEDPPDSD